MAGSMMGPMPCPALNSAFDGLYPNGVQGYWKADYLPELGDGVIRAHLERAASMRTPCARLLLRAATSTS